MDGGLVFGEEVGDVYFNIRVCSLKKKHAAFLNDSRWLGKELQTFIEHKIYGSTIDKSY